MGNAVKFTESGSVKLVAGPTGEGLRFEVTDTGIGIPAEHHAAIFESFSQADGSSTRKFGGTGIGLALARQVAELMGGTIGMESKPGTGSTFWVEIPLGFESRVSAKPKAKEPQQEIQPVATTDT